MTKLNRVCIVTIGLLMLISLPSIFGVYYFGFDRINEIQKQYSLNIIQISSAGFWIAYVLAFLLVLMNGTIIKSSFKYVVFLGFGISLLSFVFSVLHLPGASEIDLMGNIFLLVMYSLWFAKKDPKSTLDYLKMGWVLYEVVTLVLVFFKPGVSNIFIGQLLFWLMVIYFIFLEITGKNSSGHKTLVVQAKEDTLDPPGF